MFGACHIKQVPTSKPKCRTMLQLLHVIKCHWHRRSQKLQLQAWELLDTARCESAGLVESLIAEATQTNER